MAWGRRCELGCESWPDEEIYSKCVECGEPTKRWSNLTPLPADEARSLLLHAQFKTYYERRCQRLGIPVDGPIPDRKTASLAVIKPSPRPRSGGASRTSA